MNTGGSYITLDRELIDLGQLSDVERVFFDLCYAAWKSRMPGREFEGLMFSDENPVLEQGRRVTLIVARHPLYRATKDFSDRLSILSGDVGPMLGDEPGQDPCDDSYVSAEMVAGERGVSRAAVYLAIERGDLIATIERPRRVSRRSLDRWAVDTARQRAGRGEAALA